MDIFLRDRISPNSTGSNSSSFNWGVTFLSGWDVKGLVWSHVPWGTVHRRRLIEDKDSGFWKTLSGRVSWPGCLWSTLVAYRLPAYCKQELNPGSSCLLMNWTASGVFSRAGVEHEIQLNGLFHSFCEWLSSVCRVRCWGLLCRIRKIQSLPSWSFQFLALFPRTWDGLGWSRIH